MIAKILDKKQEIRQETIHEYIIVDGNNVILHDKTGKPYKSFEQFPNGVVERVAQEQGEDRKNIRQIANTLHFITSVVILTVDFSEEKFSEKYTFHILLEDVRHPEWNAENLNQRIREKIKEELVIYTKRKEAAQITHPEVNLTIGDTFEI